MLSAFVMAGSVSLILIGTQTIKEPPATHISYEVHNRGDKPIWLVNDNWFVWKQQGRQFEISFAREKMQPGVQVYGYFNPEVIKIEPGKFITRQVELTWPLSLSRIWNAQSHATPKPGEYKVSIRIGYGLSPEPGEGDEGDDMESPVLRWQNTLTGKPLKMVVPNYHVENNK